MTTPRWNAFEQRLSCEESLYADSEALAWPPSPELLQQLAERNAGALATLAALEERHADLGDDDNPLMQELLRMDAKLTALVEIVNQLLLPTTGLPPRRVLRFNALGAVVPAALVPPGEGLLLRLRFDACRNLPLTFAAQMDCAFDDGRSFVSFASWAESTSDAMERLVFRHHRRKVAGARQQSV